MYTVSNPIYIDIDGGVKKLETVPIKTKTVLLCCPLVTFLFNGFGIYIYIVICYIIKEIKFLYSSSRVWDIM